MSNLKKIPLEQTTLSNDFSNTYKSEVDTAYTNNHTHSNKTLLDNVVASGDGTQFLANNGTYKTIVGAPAINALGAITSNITLPANSVTTAYVNSAINVTLPTNLVSGIENKCIFDFTTASTSYPSTITTPGTLKWSNNNNGMPPISYSTTSGVRNVLIFITHDGGTTWEVEYKTYGAAEATFSQPTLVSNGTLGGASFACAADVESYGAAYCAFDNNGGTNWAANQSTGDYIIFYNPNALKISSLSIYNGAEGITNWTLYGSNDNTTYTLMCNGTSPVNTTTITAVNSYQYYKYHKIVGTAFSTRSRFYTININATYIQI